MAQLTNGCSQVINLEPVIIFHPTVIEKATYNVIFTLIGINGLTGFGNWKANFQGQLNELARPINKQFPLVGSGQYGAKGSPLISSFMATLQIEVTYPPNAPLPTKPATNSKWKGTVTLTSGNVIGSLTGENCNRIPSLYNVKGVYTLKVTNGTVLISVKNITIF